MTRRRLIYGDWTWLVRDGLDVLRILFIAGTVAFAIMGRSTAVGLTAASAVLLIARVIDLPRWFDLSLIVAMTAIAWGTALGLYGDYYFYDNIVHSVSPFCYSPVLYIALVRLDVLPDPGGVKTVARRAGVFISTLALGMAVGAGYEVVEWSSDKLLGTHLVKSADDTGSDLLEDTLGSLAAAIFVTVWSIRRWSSRRIPGEPPLIAAPTRLVPALPPAWERRLHRGPTAGSALAEIAAGALLLFLQSPTLRTIEVVLGVALAARAVFNLVELIRRRARFVEGVVEIAVDLAVAGLLLTWPSMSRAVFIYTLGAATIVFAFVVAASLTVPGRSSRDRWLGGGLSVAALALGVASLAFGTRFFDGLITTFGIYLVGVGIVRLIRVKTGADPRRIEPRGRLVSGG